MYQPYPGGSQTPESYSRGTAPQSVIRASQAMYVGAAASLIGIVITILFRHSLRTAILDRNHTLTTAQLNDAYHVGLGVAIAVGLIGVGVWIWMAQMCKAGKSWARILSTVLFGLQTINLAAGAAVPGGASTTTRIYGIVIWLIGLVAVIFLWQRPSSEYFKGAPRY